MKSLFRLLFSTIIFEIYCQSCVSFDNNLSFFLSLLLNVCFFVFGVLHFHKDEPECIFLLISWTWYLLDFQDPYWEYHLSVMGNSLPVSSGHKKWTSRSLCLAEILKLASGLGFHSVFQLLLTFHFLNISYKLPSSLVIQKDIFL